MPRCLWFLGLGCRAYGCCCSACKSRAGLSLCENYIAFQLKSSCYDLQGQMFLTNSSWDGLWLQAACTDYR